MADTQKPGASARSGTIVRAGIVTNPEPLVDESLPPPEEPLPETLPLQTQQEMATGAAAIKKHAAPVLGSGDVPKPGHPDGGVGEAKHR